MSAINTVELPYWSLDEISGHPTPDPYHYPLMLDNQTINPPGEDPRYQILRVNRINKILRNSNITRNRELNRLINLLMS